MAIPQLTLPVGVSAGVVLGGAAVVERLLEARDFARHGPTQTFAEVPLGRIRYRATELELPGPPVVFLNGASAVCEQWEATQNALAGVLPTLAYDRAGTGFSHSRAHDAAEQANELSQLLSALGIQRPVIVVAYSLSASLARLFATNERMRTLGLVLIEPTLAELDLLVPDRHGPIRSYWRWYLRNSVLSLFGLYRLEARRERQGSETMALPHAQPRARAAMSRFSHWLAVDRELLASRATSRKLLEATRVSDVPTIFLIGDRERSTVVHRTYDALVQGMLAKSRHSERRSLGAAGHSKLLMDADSIALIVRAAMDLAALAAK
jgi:pimeloyl-ACP methyl ester carboxylesterase